MLIRWWSSTLLIPLTRSQEEANTGTLERRPLRYTRNCAPRPSRTSGLRYHCEPQGTCLRALGLGLWGAGIVFVRYKMLSSQRSLVPVMPCFQQDNGNVSTSQSQFSHWVPTVSNVFHKHVLFRSSGPLHRWKQVNNKHAYPNCFPTTQTTQQGKSKQPTPQTNCPHPPGPHPSCLSVLSQM